MKTFILAILIMSASGYAAASDRYIQIDTIPGHDMTGMVFSIKRN